MKRKFICIFTALSVVVILSIITKKEKEIEITHLMLSNIEALSSSLEYNDRIPLCKGTGSVKCTNNDYAKRVYFLNIIPEYDKY